MQKLHFFWFGFPRKFSNSSSSFIFINHKGLPVIHAGSHFYLSTTPCARVPHLFLWCHCHTVTVPSASFTRARMHHHESVSCIYSNAGVKFELSICAATSIFTLQYHQYNGNIIWMNEVCAKHVVHDILPQCANNVRQNVTNQILCAPVVLMIYSMIWWTKNGSETYLHSDLLFNLFKEK